MLARSPALYAKAFSPTDLGSSLLAWWNAGRGIGANWTDVKAGLVMVPAGGPVWSATSFNGAPGWTLDGVDDCFTLASQPFPSGTNGVEIFAVVQQNALVADATTRNAFSYGGNLGTSARNLQRRVVSAANRGVAVTGNGSSNLVAQDTVVDLSSRHLMAMRVTATDVFVSVDGGAEVSAAVVPATSTTRTRIGASTADTATSFWSGVIRDVIVTGPLSSGARAALTSYLMKRRRV